MPILFVLIVTLVRSGPLMSTECPPDTSRRLFATAVISRKREPKSKGGQDDPSNSKAKTQVAEDGQRSL